MELLDRIIKCGRDVERWISVPVKEQKFVFKEKAQYKTGVLIGIECYQVRSKSNVVVARFIVQLPATVKTMHKDNIVYIFNHEAKNLSLSDFRFPDNIKSPW